MTYDARLLLLVRWGLVIPLLCSAASADAPLTCPHSTAATRKTGQDGFTIVQEEYPAGAALHWLAGYMRLATHAGSSCASMRREHALPRMYSITLEAVRASTTGLCHTDCQRPGPGCASAAWTARQTSQPRPNQQSPVGMSWQHWEERRCGKPRSPILLASSCWLAV